MPLNGAGTYAAPASTWNPPITNTAINSTDWIALLADITTALSTAVYKDGQQTLTANIPMGGFKLTGLAAGVSAGNSLRYEQVIDTSGTPFIGSAYLSSVAGTNTITGTATPVPTAYVTGQRVHFIPANSNTGAATLNISSLGAKSFFLNGAALVGYELRKNCPIEAIYDGTQFNIIAGAHGGDGVAIATVKTTASSTAPNGYLLSFGQAVSRTTYADLFAVVSTTYGVGDGSSTFNLPDLRGRAVFGKDNMGGSAASRVTNGNSGITATTLGATGGDERLSGHTHDGSSLTAASGGAHTHTLSVYNNDGAQTFPSAILNAGTVAQASSTSSDGAHTHTVSGTTGSTGSGSSANMPPTLVLNFIIKT